MQQLGLKLLVATFLSFSMKSYAVQGEVGTSSLDLAIDTPFSDINTEDMRHIAKSLALHIRNVSYEGIGFFPNKPYGQSFGCSDCKNNNWHSKYAQLFNEITEQTEDQKMREQQVYLCMHVLLHLEQLDNESKIKLKNFLVPSDTSLVESINNLVVKNRKLKTKLAGAKRKIAWRDEHLYKEAGENQEELMNIKCQLNEIIKLASASPQVKNQADLEQKIPDLDDRSKLTQQQIVDLPKEDFSQKKSVCFIVYNSYSVYFLFRWSSTLFTNEFNLARFKSH